MSIKAVNWALNNVRCAPDLKIILIAMGERADDHGVCYPSQSELVDKCCIPLRTVKRKLGVLKDRGVISVITKQVKQNLRRNTYRLRLEQSFDLMELRAVGPENNGANLAPSSERPENHDGATLAPSIVPDWHHPEEQWCHSSGPINGATQVAHEPPLNHQVVGIDVVTTTGVPEEHPVFAITAPASELTGGFGTRVQVTMSDQWRPGDTVFERLKAIKGIDQDFAEDQLLGFVTYHAGTTKRQGAFESAFIKHVIYNFENRKSFPTLLPLDWAPDQITIQRLRVQGVEVNFIWEQATEFSMYWQERGTAGYGWQSKFFTRCLGAWRNRKPVPIDQSTVLDRLGDRSWSEGLQLASGV